MPFGKSPNGETFGTAALYRLLWVCWQHLRQPFVAGKCDTPPGLVLMASQWCYCYSLYAGGIKYDATSSKWTMACSARQKTIYQVALQKHMLAKQCFEQEAQSQPLSSTENSAKSIRLAMSITCEPYFTLHHAYLTALHLLPLQYARNWLTILYAATEHGNE